MIVETEKMYMEKLEKARKFCQEVKEIARKYDLPFFVVTDAYEVSGGA